MCTVEGAMQAVGGLGTPKWEGRKKIVVGLHGKRSLC